MRPAPLGIPRAVARLALSCGLAGNQGVASQTQLFVEFLAACLLKERVRLRRSSV
jgi:hypothetical protein